MNFIADLARHLRLPIMAAPMLTVTGPELVEAACMSGVVGVLPLANAPSPSILSQWIDRIQDARLRVSEVAGPMAINIPSRMGDQHSLASEYVDVATRRGVDLFVSVGGNPGRVAEIIHDRGGRVLHDVTDVRFARKAIDAGVDGLVCIASGAGGHTGHLSPLVLVSAIRAWYDGPLVLGGGVSDGRAILAVQALGADMAYVGTRFLASRESCASEEYKQLVVESRAEDVVCTKRITGARASWLSQSLESAGLDLEQLPQAPRFGDHSHLPETVRPWRTIWSAGQGVEVIADIPTVEHIVDRMHAEYVLAQQSLRSKSGHRSQARALGGVGSGEIDAT